MGISFVEGINLWLRRTNLAELVNLIILAGVIFLAYSVLQILWTEYRWYIYLSIASAVIMSVWFWLDTPPPRR